jgi:hypothetical protein
MFHLVQKVSSQSTNEKPQREGQGEGKEEEEAN